MFWINTIFVDNLQTRPSGRRRTRRSISPGDPALIELPEFNTTVFHNWNINIACQNPCVLETDLFVFAGSFQENPVIQIENIAFNNSELAFGNLHVAFRNVKFINSMVTDFMDSGNFFDQVVLEFFSTKFENEVSGSNTFGLSLSRTFTATVTFSGSELINARQQIQVPQLLYESTDTRCTDSEILFDIADLCISTFQNAMLSGPRHKGSSLVEITSTKLTLDFTGCVVEDSTGGLKLTKQDSGQIDTWMKVRIDDCMFRHNKKLGSGGALQINFMAPDAGMPELISFVEISNANFTANEAVRSGWDISMGGAVRIHGQDTTTTCHMLNVFVDGSTFTNNLATDGGGAISVSGPCLRSAISYSDFAVTNKKFDSPKGLFVWTHSEISIEKSVFKRQLQEFSPSLVALEMLGAARILKLDATVQCHEWQKITSDAKLGGQHAISLSCSSCPPSFYAPSDGQYLVSYFPGDPTVSLQDAATQSQASTCTTCPEGAYCPGNDVNGKPNFWGQSKDHVIIMHKCPAEYCCAANCDGLDQCQGQRTGTLCGQCEENHSLSVRTTECIESSTCNDNWFWALFGLAMIMYMMWYTFKNDLFGVPSMIAKKMCKQTVLAWSDDTQGVERGYFGILTFFVQVKSVMVISLSLESAKEDNKILKLILSVIDMALNFELIFIPNDTCAQQGLTTMKKVISQQFFLVGIIVCWTVLFVFMLILRLIFSKKSEALGKFKIKLILGLLEIFKYTYMGFASLMFYSLACTNVAGDRVWFYDGSVQCYNIWQVVTIVFTLSHLVPYPFLIFLGTRLLSSKKISMKMFFLGHCFPLAFFFYWLTVDFKKNVVNDQEMAENMSEGRGTPVKDGDDDVETAIYGGLRGGFRESEGGTQYWEGILMLRRLLICLTIVVTNTVIQLALCLALCLIFLIHHLMKRPFAHKLSNAAETFSLALLCGVAAINLLKARFLYGGADTYGHQDKILKDLELVELLFIIFLIVFIVCCEIALAIANWIVKENSHDASVTQVQPFAEPPDEVVEHGDAELNSSQTHLLPMSEPSVEPCEQVQGEPNSSQSNMRPLSVQSVDMADQSPAGESDSYQAPASPFAVPQDEPEANQAQVPPPAAPSGKTAEQAQDRPKSTQTAAYHQ